MKSVKKNLLEETVDLLARYAYKVHYVPHNIIEDYNATYNVICEKAHYNRRSKRVRNSS